MENKENKKFLLQYTITVQVPIEAEDDEDAIEVDEDDEDANEVGEDDEDGHLLDRHQLLNIDRRARLLEAVDLELDLKIIPLK